MPPNPDHTPLIDGHLDLAYLAMSGHDLLAEVANGADRCVTIPALRRGGVGLACATLFTESGADPASSPVAYAGPNDHAAAAAAARAQLDWYQRLEDRGVVRVVRCREELPTAPRMPGPLDPLPIVILMECADPIRDADDAAWWVSRGVRIVGLSWARGSRFSGGNSAPGGLTGSGRDLVAALDELSIIHDASHLSDESFDDLLNCVRGPIVASHSNCRAIAGDSPRHLRDDQIRAIAARSGVVGLNLFGRFLAAGRRASAADAVAHVRRVTELAGAQTSALGSDLDGGFGPSELPLGLEGPHRFPHLLAALREAGLDADAFAWRNWERVLRAGLPAGDARP